MAKRLEKMPVSRTFALPLLAIAILFFGAARFLPPAATGGDSAAVAAGYTNNLIPLVVILLAGALALGTLAFVTAGNDIVALQLRMASPKSWQAKYRHVFIASLLCLFVIAAFPIWSDPNNLFGQRVAMMDEGLRPYKDFEYPYGYIVVYLPYALRVIGLSIHASLVIALGLFVILGVVCVAMIVERTIGALAWRPVLFWLLVGCGLFVEPGPSLNYNFGRYALPFAVFSLLAESFSVFGPVRIFAAFAAAVLLLDFVSPEIAFGFAAAMIGWLAVVVRHIPGNKFCAAFSAVLVAALGTPMVLPEMFTTFGAYATVEALMPVVPNLIMILEVFCFLIVGAISFATALELWRGSQSAAAAVQLSLPAGYALLSAGLLPAVVGRCWPTITIAYGFVPIVMAIGYALQSGKKPAAWATASAFAVFVAYSALGELRYDTHLAIGRVESACRRLGFAVCTERPEAAGRRENEPLWRAAGKLYPRKLRGRL